MTTEDFITQLFCRVDDAMNTHPQAAKHTLAHLVPQRDCHPGAAPGTFGQRQPRL